MLDPVAGLVPDPADSDVRPRLEGIQDGLPTLAQVEPDDVGLSSRQPQDVLPRPADEERGCGRWTGFGWPSIAVIQ